MTSIVSRQLSLASTKSLTSTGVDVALGAAGLLCGAVACAATAGIDPTTLGDGGLAPALPPVFWVAVVGLNLAFVLSLGRRTSRWLAPALVTGLVLLLYAPGSLLGSAPRNAVAWRHLGVADALAHGPVDPRIDVYFNWPGFFSGLATFTDATGLSPVAVAAWAPLVNIALWSLALVVVLRTLTRDREAIVIPLWLFLLGNWIDQDYLSPQALGFLLHLTVLALVMGVLGARVIGAEPGWSGLWRGGTRVPEHPDPRLRRLTVWLVLLLGAALVASHQLTPIVLAVSLAALVAVRRSWAALLPLILVLLVVLWMLYPGSTYLVGHPALGTGDEGVVQANLTGRISGSTGHQTVQVVRMGVTFGLWLLAAGGMLGSWRAGRRDLRPYVLAAVPFLMLPVLTYGGEMLLRATLFALPFVAFFSARSVAPLRPRWRRTGRGLPRPDVVRAVALTLLLSLLCAGSVAARYGNARFDVFTEPEVRAVDMLPSIAAPGSVIVAGAASTPWGAEDYDGYTRRSLQSLCASDFRPPACVRTLRDLADHEASSGGITLLLTRGNQAELEMLGEMSERQFDMLERSVARLPGTRLLAATQDARIFHLSPTEGIDP